jgi:hypothetical protein
MSHLPRDPLPSPKQLLIKPGRVPFSGNPNPYSEEVEWQQEEKQQS